MLVKLCLLLTVVCSCLSADLTYYVDEGKGPGSFVGDIATDSHLLDDIPIRDRTLVTFNQLQLRWTGSLQLFSVNKKTGRLLTAHALDVESMCEYNKECFKMVEVAVQRGTSFMKVLEVKVVIEDINDHRPEFPVKNVRIQFSERDSKGTKVSVPNAVDKDVGVLNSQIVYELKKNKNEPFTLSVSKSVDGTSQLFINLEEKLDREVKDSYTVQVIAKDGGSPPKQSVLDVHIDVTDVNDNVPVFSQKVYAISIKNEPNEISPIFILSTQDLDAGQNGRIFYHFSPKTSEIAKNHFEINQMSGEIFLVKKFMLGQELAFKLYVKATDGGSPPLSSIVMISVNVINQQNIAPSINVNFVSASKGKTVSIPEDIEIGSFIAYVRVIDHDSGQNGEVLCVLYHDKFQLQSLGKKRYKVVLKKTLDREVADYHDITIQCQDKGSPPLRSESKFSITVVDVNDVRPTFSQKTFKFWIYEDQSANYPVGYINATDPDLGAGGQFTYYLLSDSKQFLPFQISDEGLISTVMSLDHEFQDVYRFQVLVKDNGKPSLNNTVKVVVEVKDKNDNVPYFTYPSINPFTLDVVYYPHQSKNITVLRASDSDGRENAFLKYGILSGNTKQLFNINAYSGLLSFTRGVTQQDAGSYELEFEVKDSGTPVLSAVTTIYLILTVSNKTFEMTNVVHVESDDADEQIYLDFLIVIVSVAVTLSVIITAIISVCFLRFTNRKNVTHRTERNCSSKCEQRQLMYPSYVAASCTDLPSSRIEELDMTRNTHLVESRINSQSALKLDIEHRCSASIMDLQAASEIVYQEIGAIATGCKGKRTSLLYPDCHIEVSMISANSKVVNNWKKGPNSQNEEATDAYSSHYSLAHPTQTDLNTFMKPTKQRMSCPADTKMSPKCLLGPSTGHTPPANGQLESRPGLKPSKPWTLPESRRSNFDFLQLSIDSTPQGDIRRGSNNMGPLPSSKYYVLEPNVDHSPTKMNSNSPGEGECSVQRYRPKYYILEPNSDIPKLMQSQDNPEKDS